MPARPAPPVPSSQQQPQQTLMQKHDLVNLVGDTDIQMKSDFSFNKLHEEIIGKPIRDEINERRALKARAEQPLIQF